MSRKWWGMRRSDNMMFCFINERFLWYSEIPPENKNNSCSFVWYGTNYCIRELLPSFSSMWGWHSLTHGKYRIEEKNPLLCPISEVSFCSFNSHITLQFFENIPEAWLWFTPIGDRKRESHGSTNRFLSFWMKRRICLIRRMIRILPEDNYLDIIKWSQIKCTENVFPFRKTTSCLIFFFYKSCKRIPIGFFELRLQHFMPRWMDMNGHEMKFISFYNECNNQYLKITHCINGRFKWSIYIISLWLFLEWLDSN